MAPPQGTGASNQDVRNLTSGVNQLTAAVTKSNEAAEACAESTKTKSGKEKMQSFVMHMILNASAEIDEDIVDDNGNPVPSCMDFVESYKPILECSTAGSTKQLLDHYLNNEKMCCTNIPLLTCMAVQTGKLKWMDLNQPEAFSLLAMFHLAATVT